MAWKSPRASKMESRPRSTTDMPSAGAKRTKRFLFANITQRSCARSSFRLKYQWPEA